MKSAKGHKWQNVNGIWRCERCGTVAPSPYPGHPSVVSGRDWAEERQRLVQRALHAIVDDLNIYVQNPDAVESYLDAQLGYDAERALAAAYVAGRVAMREEAAKVPQTFKPNRQLWSAATREMAAAIAALPDVPDAPEVL